MGTVFFSFIFFRTYLQPYERLYQKCSYRRKTVSQNVPSSKVSIDLQAIDNRLEHLQNVSLQSSYPKQKCLLRTEFETFLASLPNSSKAILSASPTDITRFLVWKDRHAKTVVHGNGCPDPYLQSALSVNVLNAWHSKQSNPT